MFDQQLTFDGGAEDIAPPTRQDKLFTAPRVMRGQLAMAEPTCRYCGAIGKPFLTRRGERKIECSASCGHVWLPDA
jgi:hypothetical protein